MIIDEKVIRSEEKMIFALREHYSSKGYGSYKMSRFEEYDLYVRNKDFLVSDGIITFTDTNGKLMALRPDVTLSIVKNSRYTPGTVQKVYYDEKVYRISAHSGAFSEIPQMGLEVLGDVTAECIREVLTLALDSLKLAGGEYLLTLSHPGLIAALLDEMNLSPQDRAEMMKHIAAKSRHEREALAERAGIDPKTLGQLEKLLSLSGTPAAVLEQLKTLLPGEKEQAMIEDTAKALKGLESAPIRIDFSVPGNMRYYSGLVFQGYVQGIPTAVLSGGQYDLLLKRMGKQGGAIGFAVYLDLLERRG